MSYVQIGSSRVLLDTWDDIVAAAREGLIDERSYCELKKGLPPSSQNREVACDLASLTVDGGVLIYGVTDAGDGKADDVLGISEPESAKARLIGLAQGKVAPAMACDVRVVSDPDDPARGCVIVEVPPSPIAPHSADDRYWGRSAEGKRVLPEPVVADLFARRRHRDDGLLAHLRGLTGTFDPVPADQRGHGHLYYSALPLTPPQSPPPWDHNKLPLQVVVGAQFPAHGFGGGDLTSLNYTETHPAGIMASSVDRSDPRPDEAYAKRLLIRDTGGIDFVPQGHHGARSPRRRGAGPVCPVGRGAHAGGPVRAPDRSRGPATRRQRDVAPRRAHELTPRHRTVLDIGAHGARACTDLLRGRVHADRACHGSRDGRAPADGRGAADGATGSAASEPAMRSPTTRRRSSSSAFRGAELRVGLVADDEARPRLDAFGNGFTGRPASQFRASDK